VIAWVREVVVDERAHSLLDCTAVHCTTAEELGHICSAGARPGICLPPSDRHRHHQRRRPDAPRESTVPSGDSFPRKNRLRLRTETAMKIRPNTTGKAACGGKRLAVGMVGACSQHHRADAASSSTAMQLAFCTLLST